MKTLTVIDTFGFFFRSYYALPPLRNSKGFPTGLLLGFANLIQNLYQEGMTDYLVFALEGQGQNKRKLLDPNYKANRSPTPEELLLQLPIAIEWIERMGFKSVSKEGYEADDMIASLTQWAKNRGYFVRIVSHDKDLYQLIDEQVHLYDPIKKKEVHTKECLERWGVHPQDFVNFQSLIGDSSDNIKGIKGIGPKTAQNLINYFHTLEAIYANEDVLSKHVTKNQFLSLLEDKESAFRSRELVQLHTDLIEDFDLKPFPTDNPLKKIAKDLLDFEFERLSLKVMKKSPFLYKKPPSKGIGQKNTTEIQTKFEFIPHLLNSFEKAKAILEAHPISSPIAYDCETSGLDTQSANMIGFSFCLDGKNGYYVPIAHNYLGAGVQMSHSQAKELIELIFMHPIIGHNLKFDLLVAKHNFGLDYTGIPMDSMILAWLYDSTSVVGLDKQMFRWFNHTMITFDKVVSKGETFASVQLEQACEYAAEDAVATFALFKRLESEFKANDLLPILDLAYNLEFPLIRTLTQMESSGIVIDVSLFESLQQQTTELIGKYALQVRELAQEEFNLNSPQQLSTVLFERLGLKGSKQVKGGYSTEERVLESLIDQHPVITPILQYREAYKLRNTYIEPILKLSLKHPQHKIFTSFLQTGTSTGRLSSKSPNLQNIPTRTETGKKVRQGFIAKEGNVLLSVDYSQIELRLLAHFSQDPNLVQAFQNHQDIHAKTAQKIFGTDDPFKRHIAKTINFGLIYGMGPKKLSDTLKIQLKDAKQYIQSYFDSFPTVKTFLKEQEEIILSQGYAQTLLGHRRYFDFRSATAFQKAGYLREGINSIFQGSAADLIKLSMNAIAKHIQNTSIKMLLQVHDELIFELPKEDAEKKGKEIVAIMNQIRPLKVPLECGMAIGKNWAELK